MAKLDIYGGLLGAGKTTLIRAMLQCAYRGKRVAVIENEIGRVNLDAGAFSGVTVRPLTAGCVCCTLKGDLVTAVRELLQGVAPGYIVMEASGAADLEAIRRICAEIDAVSLNRCVMVVNARKLRKLMTVVGEFYRIQLRDATDTEFHGGSSPDGARRGSRIECARADRRGPPGAVGSGCGRAVLRAAYSRIDMWLIDWRIYGTMLNEKEANQPPLSPWTQLRRCPHDTQKTALCADRVQGTVPGGDQPVR